MDSIQAILGKNIRKYRKLFGWTQADLAEKLDVSVSYITVVELGKRGVSLNFIEDCATVFGVAIADLFLTNTVIKTDEELNHKKIYQINQIAQIKKELIENINRLISDAMKTLENLQ